MSRVLDHGSRVSPATHARVRQAIDHLGYERQPLTRTGEHGAALLLADLENGAADPVEDLPALQVLR